MIRHASVLIVALCLTPAWLGAQTPTDPNVPTFLTVKTASADIHNSPSLGSAVIGHAPKGDVLGVTRQLGSWVKVSWPEAKDGVGYVHVSAGVVGPAGPPEPTRVAAAAAPLPSQVASQSAPAPVNAPAQRPVAVSSASQAVFVTPATHHFGLGGRVGGATVGFGGTARAWQRNRLGAQVEVSRYAMTSDTAPGRATSLQFEPSVLYSLPDHVGDYLWVRPYLGGGVNLRHQTLKDDTVIGAPSVSENKLGMQVFGGGEVTFAGMPRFALSVDLAYHRARTSFVGVDFGGVGASVSGHWYFR